MTLYAKRLAEAMQEAGFGSDTMGGQTRLAKEIGCRPQAISQVISGATKELSALFHVRACVRLGVRALWLAEGKGPKYERPTTATVEPVVRGVAEESRNGNLLPASPAIAMDVSQDERVLLYRLRAMAPDVLQALLTLLKGVAL